MTRRHAGNAATGGARRAPRPHDPDERPAPYEPPPHEAALLRAIWARRGELSGRCRELVHGYLQRLQRRALTSAETTTAAEIGRRLGIGYDAPDEPGDVARRPAPQPWGPLPLRPPGRS